MGWNDVVLKTMKPLLKHVLILVLSVSGATTLANSLHDKPIGVGLILIGTPGVSANYQLGPTRSIDLALAWRVQDFNETYIHSTYLWRFPDYYHIDRFPMMFYAGVGGRLMTEQRDSRREKSGRSFLGVRTAAGTAFVLPAAPVEFFAEAGITLNLVPETEAVVNVGLGGRFYF